MHHFSLLSQLLLPVDSLKVGKVGGLKVGEKGAGILYGWQSGE